MSRRRKVLLVVLATLGLFFGTVAAANAATSWDWKPGGDCSNVTNRYQFQASYGPYDVRMVSFGSRSDSWTCTRVYAGGGQTINTTMQVTRECATGNTVLTTQAYSGYRSVAVWVTRPTAASCQITVAAWTNAGYGTEYTKVTVPHA